MSRSSQRSTIKDMTNGSPAKLILGFAVPMLMGLLFQQFYSMVDTIIVGKFLGVDALASVGSTSAINFMINGFVIGVCTGFSIPVAQRFGAQDYKDMRRFVANAGWIASCFAVVMTVIVCLMTRQILVWMQTPDNIIDGAYSYIFFVFAGIPATYLYNTLAGIIRALGDSKTPVYFLILSSLLNIALDLLFIVQIGTGTAGAAYATVISQAVSGILCLIYMKKKFEILHMHREETRISGRHIYILCKMGVPMGLQYSITAIGSVVIQTAINSLGSIAVASVTAGQKIGMFFCCPFDALGGTMATYAGQNAGAGKVDRIRPVRDSHRRHLLHCGVYRADRVWRRDSASLRRCLGNSCNPSGAPVSDLQLPVLHTSDNRQCMAFHDSGNGLQPARHPGRCLRNDRPRHGRLPAGADLWLHHHLFCLAACMAARRCISDSGILLLPETFAV